MSGGVSKRVLANRRNVDIGGGVDKAGLPGSVGIPVMLRRFVTSRAPAVRGGGEDVVVEPEKRYRYFKMFITKVRVNPNVCQMSEFAFYEQNETNINLNGLSIYNPGGTPGGLDETVIALTDGNVNTKWNDIEFNVSVSNTTIIIDFGSDYISKPVPKLYKWATANDFNERDPVSWTISGSTDNTNWVVLDSQTDYPTTTNRKTYVPTTGYFSLTY